MPFIAASLLILLLTNAVKGGIIMAQYKKWDESKHPRDDQGRFAKLGSIIVGKGEPPDNLPDDLPSTRKTINPGKHSKVSEAYGNRIKTEFGIPTVDINQIDKECAEDVYYTLKSVFSEFPKVKGYIQCLRFDPDLDGLGQWNQYQKLLLLGPAFADINQLKASYELAVKHKKFLKNTTFKGVIYHEIAHMIGHMLTNSKVRYSDLVINRIYQEFNLNRNFVKTKIASYAKDDSEFFAMHIQEYMEQKQNASDIAKRIFRMVKEDLPK